MSARDERLAYERGYDAIDWRPTLYWGGHAWKLGKSSANPSLSVHHALTMCAEHSVADLVVMRSDPHTVCPKCGACIKASWGP